MRSWWWKKAAPISLQVSAAPADAAEEAHDDVGRYQSLYKYLRDRHANRVVLTFAEIEDLLGFSLPPSARVQGRWWSTADGETGPSAQSDAWRLASRTASVNLMAQTVLFERQLT